MERLILSFLLLFSFFVNAQTAKVGNFDAITTNNPSGNYVELRKDIQFTSSGALLLPVGDTASRPTASAGMFRYNSELGTFEGYTSEWGPIAGSGGGVSQWQPSTDYEADVSVVWYLNGSYRKLYVAANTFTSGPSFNIANWFEIADGIDRMGPVTGDRITVSDGTSGNLIKTTGVQIDASDNVSGIAALESTSLNLSSSTLVDSVLDEDNMASDSATALATQQSIKSYVDVQDSNLESSILSGVSDKGVVFGSGSDLLTDAVNFVWDNVTKSLSIAGSLIVDTFTLDGSDIASTSDITITPDSKVTVNGGLESVTTTQASLPCPRMTQAQMDLITPSAEGYCVYNTTFNAKYRYDGTKWVKAATTREKSIYHIRDFEEEFDGDLFSCLDGGVIGGGSPIATFAGVEETNPLDDERSLIFTIPSSGTGKYCLINASSVIPVPKFAQNGKSAFTFVADGTADYGDISLFLWDTTNAETIKDNDGNTLFINPRANVGNTLYFNTNGTEALQWGAFINRDNTGATLIVDNVEIQGNPDKNISVYASRPSVDFTPTGTWTTNATYTGSYSRQGEFALISYTLALTGAPNSTDLTFNLPEGLEWKDNKNYTAAVHIVDAGTRAYPAIAYRENTSSSTSRIRIIQPESSNFGSVNQSAPFTFASGDKVDFSIRVPIKGWSDKEPNVIVAGTNDKLAYVEAAGSTEEPITVNTEDIPFIGVFDNKGLWDGTKFTANRDMVVTYSGMVTSTTAQPTVSIYETISGAITKFVGRNPSSSGSLYKFDGIAKLSEGQTLSLRVGDSITTSSLADRHHLTIQELPSEDLIYAYLDESRVGLHVSGNSGQALGASAITVKFDNEIYKNGIDYNPLTGIATVKKSGLYHIQTSLGTAQQSSADDQYILAYVNLGGVVRSQNQVRTYGGQDYTQVQTGLIYPLSEGDEILVDCASTIGGGRSLVTGDNVVYLSVYRIR
tara:strand:- start:14024 stop:16912 length:2889 start_codon:yes stop_codon:yes gene_type:complete